MTPAQLAKRYDAHRWAEQSRKHYLTTNDELHAVVCKSLSDTHGPEIRALAERTNDPLAVHIVSHWGDETEEKRK